MSRYRLEDDVDDDPDEDDDVDDDDEDSDEDDDDDEDVETWQVSLKYGLCLTSGAELPMLAPIFQFCYSWRHSAGLASRRRSDLSKAPVTG